jgi:hypothetical protein
MSWGRRLSPLRLSEPERAQLSEWTRRPKTAQALVMSKVGEQWQCRPGESSSVAISQSRSRSGAGNEREYFTCRH